MRRKIYQYSPVAGQELIQMGRIKGKIIGKIHPLMKHSVMSEKKLAQSPEELRAILKKLEIELKAW